MSESTDSQGETLFGDWLQGELNSRRMTVQELAEKARISRGGIYHYLKNKRVPDQTAIARIAGAFSIELSSLPATTPKRVGRPKTAP